MHTEKIVRQNTREFGFAARSTGQALGGSALAAILKMRTLIAIVLLTLTTWCHAEPIRGRVVGVLDGDTIDVLDTVRVSHRIRLAGIDAPEKSQAYGHRSKQSLSDLIFSKEVSVEVHKRDRYGREVGKVIQDGEDVNLEQIRRGMAWFYRQYERELLPEDQAAYDVAEEMARNNKRGLWADQAPLPPWAFRRR